MRLNSSAGSFVLDSRRGERFNGEMHTLRTFLRRLQPSDLKYMQDLESDPEVMRFTPSRIPLSTAQTQERMRVQIEQQPDREPFGIWLAEEREGGAFIGWFMLVPTPDHKMELGFMLVRVQWGRGFATEVAQGLIEYAKARGVTEFKATTNIDNTNSMCVLQKIGFRYARNIRVPEKVFGGEMELKVFELKVEPSI